jgi:hypothetical protein
MPDLMNMTPEDLNLALESLPLHMKGPFLPRISLQEAMKVTKGMFHTDHRPHQNLALIISLYMISKTDIVYNIVFDIVRYRTIYTISFQMLDNSN